MANRKISELDEATELLSTDILPVVTVASSTTKKATFQKLLGLVSTSLKPLSNPASSALDMASNKITGLADPTTNTDAATKSYVDTGLSGKASTSDLAAKANLSANTFTGTQTGGDNSLVQWNLKDYGITFLDKGTTSGTSTVTFDYTAGSNQKLTIAASSSTTLAVSNWPPSGNLGQLLIELTNGAASGAVIAWPTINWILSNGTVTTSFASNGVTLQASGNDFILLWTRDGGTTVYGKVVR